MSKFKEFVSENKMPIILSVIILAFLGFVFWLSESNKIDLSNVDTSKVIAASSQTGDIE